MTFESNYLLANSIRFSRFFALSICATCVAQASTASSVSLELRWPVWVKPKSPPVAVVAPSLPYLAKLGASPLRFAPPAPEAVARPEPPDTPSVAVPIVTTETVFSDDPTTDHAPPPVQPVDASTKLLRILPDDTPREVRAEDVMSYFQLPQERERPSASGSNQPFAAGTTLPTSSATYQQK